MLRIQMIGLAVVAAVMMSAVSAPSAFAAHEWLINGAPIASPIKGHSSGLIFLEDSKATGGAIQIHCKGFGSGTVGSGAAGLVESITTELLKGSDKIPCTFVKAGLCKSNVTPTILVVHLPWKTELVLLGTEVRDLYLSDGNGAPGVNFTCTNAFGGTTEDECVEEAGHPGSLALANVSEGVLATFDSQSPSSKCSIGGAGAGIVSGTILTKNLSSTEKLTFD